MTKSESLIYFCLSFVGGICMASFFVNSIIVEIIGLIIGLILIGAFYENKIIVVAGFCFIFCSIGMFLFGFNLFKIENNELIKFNNKEVIFEGVISNDPERGSEKIQTTVDILNNDKKLGRVLVFTDKYSPVNFGDIIKIKGTIKVPEKFDNFDYRGYLAKDGISAIISFPEIEIIKSQKTFIGKVYDFKKELEQRIKDNLSPKLSSILEAMILGNDQMMDKETKDKLSKSGLSHVIAISGSHIVLFSAMLFEVLLFFGLWRKQALLSSIVFTLFYVFLVGMPASGVRAGIMVGLLFLAQLISRQSFNLRTLVIAASVMLLFNPLLLKFDLGFQLSFMAVLGIILMGPIFNKWLDVIFRGKINWLQEIVAMTISAQLFTLPLLISSFGYFSIISLFSNIIVLPITPILMALGILVPILGPIVAIPCSFLLSYLMWVVDFSSRASFAIMKVDLPFTVLLITYSPFLYLIYKGKKKELEFLNG
ncbi:MAG TPA: ComEC/Rec2 family competence protein [Candidatus Pacearchaeota archaeon]|nr:ComEC/Rec2 family competence protein [Candidatus Pacearchaeota archaeon]HPR79893.1 ComEC/Rec2 family competence protein [Candidatus Pacearchaeota archaeon]